MIQQSLSRELEDVLWGIRRSVRYHDRRKGFHDFCHMVTTSLALLLGSATFFSIAKDNTTLQTVSAALVTLTASLDLVIGFSRKACLHEELKRRFISLERRALEGADALELEKVRLEIEADEPPVMKALDVICHNELLLASGCDKSSPSYYRLPRIKALTANLIPWDIHPK